MTEPKDNGTTKSKFSFNSFFYGALFTYFIVVPFKDGRYQKIYNKFFDKKDNVSYSKDKMNFREINRKVSTYQYHLFNEYYGKNSVSKAMEYYDQNNYSNQLNPTNDAYWQTRGYEVRPKNWEDLLHSEIRQTQNYLNNHSNQSNPNNNSYWRSRGYSERPNNWQSASGGGANAAMNNHANQMNPNNSAYNSSRGGGGGGKGKK